MATVVLRAKVGFRFPKPICVDLGLLGVPVRWLVVCKVLPNP